jgi:predicted ATPase
MNEKLTVRNFGPITEAEVEFKRVTVFIGPTGGGKSTLAKLAAIFRDGAALAATEEIQRDFDVEVSHYGLLNYFTEDTLIHWRDQDLIGDVHGRVLSLQHDEALTEQEKRGKQAAALFNQLSRGRKTLTKKQIELIFAEGPFPTIYPDTFYIPAERLFAGAVIAGSGGLLSHENALPKTLLSFVNDFQVATQDGLFKEYPVPLFNLTHHLEQGRSRVTLPNGTILDLTESASGIQAAVPLLLVIERNARYEGLNHFIVEEIELNLFPNLQRAILQEVIKVATPNDGTLLLTTHSPYILSHLNLLLYAHQIATQYPDRADEVAQLVPRESWINPQEFAAYYVGEGTARSIVNTELGLIDDNELDAISGDQADAFDNLIRLSKGFAVK